MEGCLPARPVSELSVRTTEPKGRGGLLRLAAHVVMLRVDLLSCIGNGIANLQRSYVLFVQERPQLKLPHHHKLLMARAMALAARLKEIQLKEMQSRSCLKR